MIDCRAFAEGDEDAFVALYRACLAHYGIPPATPAQEARVLNLLRGGRHMSCLMAYDGTAPVGFATWALTFPAGAGVALYMKELFVRADTRGRGVGRALLSGLIDIAEAEGCTRIDWQTDADNATSRTFYAGINAPGYDKLSFRLTADAFAGFRSSLD